MEKTEITVIGAGAVGLAIAHELSNTHKNIILLEKNEKCGMETSSRNSEVIHAGIYYKENSLKAELCVEGKGLLYDFLNTHNLPHKQCGKYIFAYDKDGIEKLNILKEQGEKNGVDDLKFVSPEEITEKLPDVKIEKTLFSPSTGIFDTHQYMHKLESLCDDNGVLISYNSEVKNIEKEGDLYKITVQEAAGSQFEFLSEIVINSSGLQCEQISKAVGIESPEYKIFYAKGEYFSLPGKYKDKYQSLIYPTVPLNTKSLGIHTVIDLQGMLKLGPNIHYINEINYDVDESHREEFFENVIKYLPFIKKEDIAPDMSGIRPKLQGPDDDFRDFIIREESDKGFPGFINLIGIESPGLTSSLSIAKHVNKIL